MTTIEANNIRPILPDYEPSMALIPPFRFANVEPSLARGAYPTLMNFRFLSLLKLKTIVCLIPENPIQDLLDFCSINDIECHHFSVAKYNETVALTKSTMVAILQVLIDAKNVPCYIHCLDGINITGLVIACFRKLQNWDRPSIVHEFCRFGFGLEMISEELLFVDEFDGKIVVPGHLKLCPRHCQGADQISIDYVPEFLWNGASFVKHPSIKLVQASAITRSGEEMQEVNQAGYEIDAKTHAQPQFGDDPVRHRRQTAQYDILCSNEENRIHDNRRKHQEAKERFSLSVRSMGLESSLAMQFRTRMLSLIDLDSAQESEATFK